MPSALLCRAPHCDIRIKLLPVSRQHAEILVDDAGAVWINALSKHNKLLVAGKCVTGKSLLRDKDSIQIHDCIFYFHARSLRTETSQSKVVTRALIQSVCMAQARLLACLRHEGLRKKGVGRA